MNQYGKGTVAYVAAPLFEVFWSDTQWYLGDVAHNVLDLLVHDKLIELDAPRSVELNVTEKDSHIVVHLINYWLHKETNHVQEIRPVFGLELRVSSSLVETEPVLLLPEQERLEAVEQDHMVTVNIPRLALYAQVVFEKVPSE